MSLAVCLKCCHLYFVDAKAGRVCSGGKGLPMGLGAGIICIHGRQGKPKGKRHSNKSSFTGKF